MSFLLELLFCACFLLCPVEIVEKYWWQFTSIITQYQGSPNFNILIAAEVITWILSTKIQVQFPAIASLGIYIESKFPIPLYMSHSWAGVYPVRSHRSVISYFCCNFLLSWIEIIFSVRYLFCKHTKLLPSVKLFVTTEFFGYRINATFFLESHILLNSNHRKRLWYKSLAT